MSNPYDAVVLDSNVFAKLFLNEPGRDTAAALLNYLNQRGIVVLEPEIFRYEVVSIAAQNGLSPTLANDQVDRFVRSGTSLVTLAPEVWTMALKMTETGHGKSGYPSIYDSAYHCLALANDALFITADQRHIAKAQQFGHIVHLDDWRNELTDS